MSYIAEFCQLSYSSISMVIVLVQALIKFKQNYIDNNPLHTQTHTLDWNTLIAWISVSFLLFSHLFLVDKCLLN